MSMATQNTIKQDLEMLSMKAHTAESFGRAIIAGSLAAAAKDTGAAAAGATITLRVDVTVTRIPKVGAYVCVGIPGFGRFCRLERDDTP
jgi:hypothetical protein